MLKSLHPYVEGFIPHFEVFIPHFEVFTPHFEVFTPPLRMNLRNVGGAQYFFIQNVLLFRHSPLQILGIIGIYDPVTTAICEKTAPPYPCGGL